MLKSMAMSILLMISTAVFGQTDTILELDESANIGVLDFKYNTPPGDRTKAITFRFSDDSATQGKDFLLRAWGIATNPETGVSLIVVEIEIIDDSIPEMSEYFDVMIDIGAATVFTGRILIKDNDGL